jgi:hypothetical protein
MVYRLSFGGLGRMLNHESKLLEGIEKRFN